MSDYNVCVYCGSRTGNNPAHTAFAKELGYALADNNYGLVFGAGSIGLMNEIANAVIEQGGDTFGVIPTHLNTTERAHKHLGKLKITKDMHERKATMAKFADAFIAMPGGFGTFEELLEIITWLQLGLHKKPIIVANVDGYYDTLLAFFDEATATGFVTPQSRSLFYTATTVAQCMEHLGQENGITI